MKHLIIILVAIGFFFFGRSTVSIPLHARYTSDDVEWVKVVSHNCIGVYLDGTHKKHPCEEPKTDVPKAYWSSCDTCRERDIQTLKGKDAGISSTTLKIPKYNYNFEYEKEPREIKTYNMDCHVWIYIHAKDETHMTDCPNK